MFTIVPLENYFNNSGISFKNSYEHGDFSGAGSSYPAEDLPESNSLINVEEIPFKFPSKVRYDKNNMEFAEQIIDIEPNYYRCIHILGAADNGSFIEPIELITERNKIQVLIGLTDWISKQPTFNEKIAFRCKGAHSKRSGYIEAIDTTIWYQKIEILKYGNEISKLVFIDNPGMHIFALTLEHLRGGKHGDK